MLAYCKEKLRLATQLGYSSVREKRQQDDDRDRNAKQPEKNASTHDVLLYIGRGVRTRSFHVPSRNEPPSTAARLAANAPNNMAAVNQKDSFAAPFRALSAAVFASAITSSTRLSAWGSLKPVRAATTCATYVLSAALRL